MYPVTGPVHLIRLCWICPPFKCEQNPILLMYLLFLSSLYKMYTSTLPVNQTTRRRRRRQRSVSQRFPVSQMELRIWCLAATEDPLASVALQIMLKLLDPFRQTPQIRRQHMGLLPQWRRICLAVLMLDPMKLDTIFHVFSTILLQTSYFVFSPIPSLLSSSTEQHR